MKPTHTTAIIVRSRARVTPSPPGLKEYFWCEATGETRWERPGAAGEVARGGSSSYCGWADSGPRPLQDNLRSNAPTSKDAKNQNHEGRFSIRELRNMSYNCYNWVVTPWVVN